MMPNLPPPDKLILQRPKIDVFNEGNSQDIDEVYFCHNAHSFKQLGSNLIDIQKHFKQMNSYVENSCQ